MSIRLKLVLSYAAMLVIPLAIMVITASLLVLVFRGDFQSVRDQYGQDGALFENHTIERMVKEMKRASESNASILTNSAYLEDVSRELEINFSGLIIIKNNQALFISDSLKPYDLLNQLPPATEHPLHVEKEEPIQLGKQWLEIVHFNLTFPDQQEGRVFIVTKVNPLVNFARKFFPVLFVTLLIILVLTHTLLTYFVSKSIISPLQQLKYAINRMKEGDLDVPIQIKSKDEIGQLSLAFEQMRRELRQSIETQLQYEENRKELVSNISHDLRTPLTAIRGYVLGLEDGVADTPVKRQKYIEIISIKAEEMDHLIDELFLYSKLDLKQLPFNFEMVDLTAFLLDLSEELDFELGKQGVLYTSNISLEPETELSIDRDKMKRVFSNIVDNCLKYMNKPNKQIHLRACGSSHFIEIDIQDNGQGIDADALPHIFDRFYRADPSRNSNTGGSGLGLAISKQIIEGHGGAIRVTSKQDEGTCLSIQLPLKPNIGEIRE